MPVFIDPTGRTVSLATTPQRIISLVPSQTELLFDLGLDTEVAGITKFCVRPDEWFRTKPRVGGTKQVNMDAVHALRPDLIIANKEENVKEQIEELEKHYPVWVSDVNKLADAYEMIEQTGLLTGKAIKSKEIVSLIKREFSQLTAYNPKLPACYLIWQNPYMTTGGDTFIRLQIYRLQIVSCCCFLLSPFLSNKSI
jgi:ABC-type Fe3+-hydroxamate transport system substrate-binding protein